MNPTTFCIAPWTHTCVLPTGKLAPCCVWKGDSSFPFTQFNDWINSEDLRATRKDLHNGTRVSTCTQCWINEDAGKKSLRQIYNAEFSKHFKFASINDQWMSDGNITTFDLKLGNLCNLKCVMCNGNSSSQLMSEYKTNVDKFRKIDFCKVPDVDTDFTWPESNEFSQFLDIFKDKIRWIKFTGGEPAMNPYMLKLLDEIPSPELVTISLTTNGTKLNEKMLTTLSKFKKLWLSVSLEGIGDANDQIRYPSKWNEVASNTLRLSKLHNAFFNVNYVFQCFSVVTLIPMLQWCDLHNLKIEMQVLTNPVYLSLNGIRPAAINEFKLQLESLTSVTNQPIIGNTLALLKTYLYDANLEKQRIEYLTMLDSVRGSDVRNVI